MSKRFGRNQKRAMREEIAKEKERASLSERHLKASISNQAPIREALNRVASVLGKHFYGLPPVQMHIGAIQKSYRMPRIQDAAVFAETGLMSSLINYAIDELSVMSCSAARDEMRGTVHLRFETPAGHFGYGISEAAFRRTTAPEIEHEIAPMIARELSMLITKR